jgi:hypothetical protein
MDEIEWRRDRLRRLVAEEIADNEMSYEEVLHTLQEWDAFGHWDEWELWNRPVDVDELADCVYKELVESKL